MINKFNLFGKIINLCIKKTKSGVKAQEIEIIKIKYHRYALIGLLIISLSMCIAASFIPEFRNSEWWYHAANQIIDHMTNN